MMTLIRKSSIALLICLFMLQMSASKTFGQCSVATPPIYSNTSLNQYFTAITASGTGVVSTIAFSTVGCCTTDLNYFPAQGISAPPGTTVNMSIDRFTTTYVGYLSIYVDWNNNGFYSPGELAGTMVTMPTTMTTTPYSFTIPMTGIVAGTNLHMRIMLSELGTGAPCTADWGQTAEYYLNVTCPPMTVSVTPTSGALCAGGPGVILSAGGAGAGGTYAWTPTIGLSPTSGALVSAAPSGTRIYTVTGTSTIGCTSWAATTITVVPLPPATIAASGPVALCPGRNVTLSAPAGTYTYRWSNASGPIPGATNMTYTTSTPGTYSLDVTNSFGCVTSSTSSAVVTSLLSPTASMAAAGFTTFCTGGSVSLNAAVYPGYTYTWTNAGSPIAGAFSPSYTASADGIYQVVATDANGCRASSSGITVVTVPAPVVDTSGPTKLCGGRSVTLSVSVPPGATGVTYAWQKGLTPIPGAVMRTYLANSPGTYLCVVSVAGSCVYSTPPVTVTSLPAITPIVSMVGGYLTTSSSYLTYQWYLNGNLITGATTYKFKPIGGGNYRVAVTNANGCTSVSNDYGIGGLGIANELAGDFRIFPNPATSIVHISAPVDVRVVVTGIEGKVLFDRSNVNDVDISGFANGMYYISLYNEKGDRLVTEKLVKE